MGKLARNYIYNIIYQILVLVAPIVTAPYLARVLGAELLGTANYVVTVSGVFTTIGLLGMQNYAIREIAYVKKDKSALEKCFYELSATRMILLLLTMLLYVGYIYISKYPQLMWIQIMYVIAVFVDASTIGDLAKAVQQLFGDTGTNIIGTRHGEKLFETLMTREERLRSQDMGHYFRVAADNRDLNYDKFVVKGEVHTMADESYTSHNTTRLDVEGTVKKIMTTEYVQNALLEEK